MIINSHFYKSTIVLTMFAIIMITQGCEKDLPRFVAFEPYSFSNVDNNGGTWKQVHMTNVEQIKIDIPAAPDSDVYKNEIASAKTAISSMTTHTEQLIQ